MFRPDQKALARFLEGEFTVGSRGTVGAGRARTPTIGTKAFRSINHVTAKGASIMAIRSRWIHLTTALAASLGLAMLAVISSASHEQDEPPAAPNGVFVGPARGESVAMPRGLIGLTITLGLKDEERTPWNGEVTVSEGRVLSLDVIQGALNASSEGSKFKVATKNKAAAKKKAARQEEDRPTERQQKAVAATIPAVIYVNLEAPETATVTVRSGQGTFSFKPADLSRTGRNMFLDDQASVERQEAAVRLTGARHRGRLPRPPPGPPTAPSGSPTSSTSPRSRT